MESGVPFQVLTKGDLDRYAGRKEDTGVVDLRLSGLLTREIRKLNPDFGKVVMVAATLSQEGHHGISAQHYDGDVNFIRIAHRGEAEKVLDILIDPRFSELRIGVQHAVFHEIGHQRHFSYEMLGNDPRFEKYAPECVAEMFAVSKDSDPRGALAALLVVHKLLDDAHGEFIAAKSNDGQSHAGPVPQRTLGEVAELQFRHVSRTLPFVTIFDGGYTFPLRRGFLEEVVEDAERLHSRLIASKR